MEIQKTLKSQNNLEKEQSWRQHTLLLWTILLIQSYTNQNRMGLEEKNNTQINATE